MQPTDNIAALTTAKNTRLLHSAAGSSSAPEWRGIS
jgi:hypothetical protein